MHSGCKLRQVTSIPPESELGHMFDLMLSTILRVHIAGNFKYEITAQIKGAKAKIILTRYKVKPLKEYNLIFWKK